MFPAVDPIPLPAPVWLFKLLHIVTLALHFAAVHLLVGGLSAALAWGWLGRRKADSGMLGASGAVMSRLPVVMTYVINFGVPPLLFAQVLYGRAIYTSSVLMGAWWLSVVFLLMASYWCLYVISARVERGAAWGWIGLLALLLIAKIGAIYVGNMTLMLRPGVWQDMYRNDPSGLGMPKGDPTILPRWLFMMVGSVAAAGAGLRLLALKQTLDESSRTHLAKWGSRLLAAGILLQVGAAIWLVSLQTPAVQDALSAHLMTRIAGYAWLATAALLLACGVLGASGRANAPLAVGGALAAFLNVACAVLWRDGLRDAVLAQSGYDVWNRAVETNWSVVILFLVLFVAGLGVAGWLISVVASAKQEREAYA